MNPTNDRTGEQTMTPAPPAATPAPKPKRVRRPNQRRPKVFPAPVRQKLALLGHQPMGSDTSDANLNYLIERLSTDLQSYQMEAQHWQDKYLAFKNTLEANGSIMSEEGGAVGQESVQEMRRRGAERTRAQQGHTTSARDSASTSAGLQPHPRRPGLAVSLSSATSSATDPSSLFLPLTHSTTPHHGPSGGPSSSSSSSTSLNDPISNFEYELLHRLQSIANPTLALTNLPLPNLRSTVGKSHRLLAGPAGEQAFDRVLTAVSSLAHLFGMYSPAGSHRWAGITKLKPDFSETKARSIWNDIFAPINIDPARLLFDSAPSCRRQLTYDLEDPDMDHMDRKLAKASDLEIVDMLHYCSLLITGMHQAAFEDQELSDARDHMGRNCERLLREAIFSRNIGTNPHLAQGLLAGIIGMLRHFSTQHRMGAVISILEIAWQMSVQHVAMIHPIIKGLVTFLSTVMAPSASRRAVWMARNQENFQSTSERYFHLTTTAYFTASYYALWMKDEDALLHYVAQLDEILAPCSSHEAIVNAPRYHDPASPCVLEVWHDNPGIDGARSVTEQSDHSVSNNSWPNPQYFSSNELASSPLNQHTNSTSLNASLHSASSQSSDQQQNQQQIAPPSSSSNYIAPYPTVQDSTDPDNHGPYLSTNPISPSSSDSTYHYPHVEGTFVERSPRSSDADAEGTYIPDENFKTLLRVAVHLIRAEACLINMDEAMCRYWVDEAEETLKTIPLMFSSQRIFLVDVSTLKDIFKTKCTFPTGVRSVCEEFERRMLQNDREKLKNPELLKSTLGTTVYVNPNSTQTSFISHPTAATVSTSWEPGPTSSPTASGPF